MFFLISINSLPAPAAPQPPGARKVSYSMTVPTPKPPRRALTLDVARYQRMPDSSSSTDAQKREMIEALWTIITAFVDLGYGIHPAQNTDPETCGKFGAPADPLRHAPQNQLESDHIQEKGGA